MSYQNPLNAINFAGWKEDPNVQLNIARVIEKASWSKSPFESFFGKGADRGVRFYAVKDSQPYRPRLKAPLTGTGVEGNADLDTNYDSLEIMSQTTYPKVIANAIKSEIEKYTALKQIDFIKEASDSLTDWMRLRRDKALVSALITDFTNCVVCDQTSNFKDTSSEPDVATAAKKIKKGDVMNVQALRRAIFMARTGINYKGKECYPLKPIKSDLVSVQGISLEHNSYIILLDSYACNQLKNDPEWIEMQKAAGVRGDENRIFTGLIGLIDNCPVLDMGIWTPLQSGMPNSEVSDTDYMANINPQNHKKLTPPSYYAGGAPVSIGALIGASALVMVGGDKVDFYIDEADSGRKTIVGVDRLLAVSKARFDSNESGSLSPFHDTDFACIGIFSSKE